MGLKAGLIMGGIAGVLALGSCTAEVEYSVHSPRQQVEVNTSGLKCAVFQNAEAVTDCIQHIDIEHFDIQNKQSLIFPSATQTERDLLLKYLAKSSECANFFRASNTFQGVLVPGKCEFRRFTGFSFTRFASLIFDAGYETWLRSKSLVRSF